MLKKIAKLLFSIGLIAGLIAAYFAYCFFSQQTDFPEQNKSLLISDSESLSKLSSQLLDENILKMKKCFCAPQSLCSLATVQ